MGSFWTKSEKQSKRSFCRRICSSEGDSSPLQISSGCASHASSKVISWAFWRKDGLRNVSMAALVAIRYNQVGQLGITPVRTQRTVDLYENLLGQVFRFPVIGQPAQVAQYFRAGNPRRCSRNPILRNLAWPAPVESARRGLFQRLTATALASFCPFRAAWIMAEAQPTPLSTWMAPVNAIQLAGSAFHADLRPHQHGQPAIHLEVPRAGRLRAHAAAITQRRFVHPTYFPGRHSTFAISFW